MKKQEKLLRLILANITISNVYLREILRHTSSFDNPHIVIELEEGIKKEIKEIEENQRKIIFS